ncbi:MAG: molybdate ABC transporter substrate-binding protein [Hyphomicrobiales bacterium]|nr:MAG: molybdate ABC transporter substrate-binding protein [Hyphomicrobiales bacterium]
MGILRLLFVFAVLLTSIQLAKADQLVLYVAASMKEAVEEISATYEKKCDCKIVISVGGTGTLARQIEQGAPADIFISADKKWMEYLSEKHAINEASIEVIASNQLVIAMKADIAMAQSPLNIMDEVRFAMGNPQSVPAGRYAKEALENLGKWQVFRPHAVLTENVRAALAMVARGDLALAIVYKSDLMVDPRVKSAYRFAPESHSKILYLAALTNTAKPTAEAFLKFLKSPPAQAILQKFGFSAVTDK